MLDKNSVLFWNEVECDLYEENGKVFGVELDLFNGHKSYYYKNIRCVPFHIIEEFEYLDDNIYKAIEQFNEKL